METKEKTVNDWAIVYDEQFSWIYENYFINYINDEDSIIEFYENDKLIDKININNEEDLRRYFINTALNYDNDSVFETETLEAIEKVLMFYTNNPYIANDLANGIWDSMNEELYN